MNGGQHREEILSSPRKYIYPLSHSKHRGGVVTTGLLITAIVVFLRISAWLCTIPDYINLRYGVTPGVPVPWPRLAVRG